MNIQHMNDFHMKIFQFTVHIISMYVHLRNNLLALLDYHFNKGVDKYVHMHVPNTHFHLMQQCRFMGAN